MQLGVDQIQTDDTLIPEHRLTKHIEHTKIKQPSRTRNLRRSLIMSQTSRVS